MEFCGNDFQEDGSFCSKECEEKYKDSLKPICEVCGKKIDLSKEVKHHISYIPENVILVHASCHNKIHKKNLFPHLKPSKSETDKFYKK